MYRESFFARYQYYCGTDSLSSDPAVANWFFGQNEQSLYISVVTIGEMRRGFVMLPVSKKRRELERWLQHDLLPRFRGRVLRVTRSIADRWGALDGQRQLKGTHLNIAEGLIAATALEHDITIVARNALDFAGLGVKVFNPRDAL
jgi:toxin FitB